MGLVLDTSALIAVERFAVALKGEAAWARQFPQLASEPVVLPAIVVAEVLVGVAMADTAMRMAARRLQFGVLVGPSDEKHFQMVDDLRVETLRV